MFNKLEKVIKKDLSNFYLFNIWLIVIVKVIPKVVFFIEENDKIILNWLWKTYSWYWESLQGNNVCVIDVNFNH